MHCTTRNQPRSYTMSCMRCGEKSRNAMQADKLVPDEQLWLMACGCVCVVTHSVVFVLSSQSTVVTSCRRATTGDRRLKFYFPAKVATVPSRLRRATSDDRSFNKLSRRSNNSTNRASERANERTKEGTSERMNE